MVQSKFSPYENIDIVGHEEGEKNCTVRDIKFLCEEVWIGTFLPVL